MSITTKIIFDDSVEFTTMNNDEFLIYYRKGGELIKYSLPLSLIKDFSYIDIEQTKICPICKSSNIIIPETENKDVMYFDGIDNWECLSCGSTEISLEIKPPKSIPQFKPRYMGRKVKEIINDNDGAGSFSYLRVNGYRYKNVLHWFRLPRGLLPIVTNDDGVTIKTIPIFKYYEKEWYIYLEYLWYLDGIQHIPPTSKHLVDDCRVTNKRYLRTPKDFNRSILKYKYPDLWNLVDAQFKWKIENNYVTLQIKWDKKKYFESLMGAE